MKRSIVFFSALNVGTLGVVGLLSLLHDGSWPPLAAVAATLLLAQVAALTGANGLALAITLLLIVWVQPLTAPFAQSDYRTLPPHMDVTIDMDHSGLYGVTGPTRLRTDDNGFRATGDYRDDGTFKIFTVGGSTTEQIALDEQETTSALLARHLGDRVAVVNTGVSGLRAVHHTATVRAISRYEPDLIVILLGVNDWNCMLRNACDSGTAMLNPVNWLLTVVSTRVLETLRDRPAPNASEQDAAAFRRYYDAVMNRYDTKPNRSLAEFGDPLRHFRADLAALVEACGASGAHCLFLTQPTGYTPSNFEDADYRRSLWMTPPNTSWALPPEDLLALSSLFNDYVLQNVSCERCTVLDLASVMGGAREFFYDDVHFTEAGAAKAAEVLERFILGSGVLER